MTFWDTRFLFHARQMVVRLIQLVPLTLAVSAFAADAPLEDLLEKVQDHYNHSKTLQVLFTEEYTPPGSIRRTESGTLLLRKPGKMRGEYSQPKGKLFISDGKYLWLYTPADHRAEKLPLKATEDMRAPLAFLLGKLNFQREFRDVQATPEGAGTRIKAEPKGENLPYSAVEFLVTQNSRIQELKVTGFDRSVLHFIFDQEKVDPPLDSKLFQFQLPAGAVLEESAQ
ncbi:MAG: outer membrane lipoprotein carrier protein LolA [Acidobacteriia bacterium]|nr:outer membrane lipoprotein carrier protein LolA [Terriglobia bacterium]